MDTEEQVKLFAEWINECKPKGMVFFGGAGVSTESGIPDFRSQDGLYNQKYSYPPEVMVSHSFLWNHTKEFYDFYFDKMIFDDAKPNAAHLKLAEFEKAGKLSAVVTQNIDGLHQAAGSENVLELHGTVHQNYCTQCNAFYDLAETKKAHDDCPDGIPHCPKCGGIIKPDVVLYEEPLNQRITSQAIEAISEAELLVIAGTSLVVYPAAGMIDSFHGKHLVIVNLTPTQADRTADLCICEKVGKVFKAL